MPDRLARPRADSGFVSLQLILWNLGLVTRKSPSLHCLLLLMLCAPTIQSVAQDSTPPSDTPETLAAMRALLPPLPAEIPHWDELPPDVRKELADFRIGMHRWHADPAQRFVVVEGRRVAEGGVLGQELWLREVRADAVVLQFRDQIFLRER
jgi:general secretion pathway protein B